MEIKRKDNIEISIKKRQQKEKFRFVGELNPKPNQRCFKLDLDKLIVTECEYTILTDTINYLDALNNTNMSKYRTIIIEDNFDYIIKLNIKNALSYFRKIYNNKNIKIGKDKINIKQFKNHKTIRKYKN